MRFILAYWFFSAVFALTVTGGRAELKHLKVNYGDKIKLSAGPKLVLKNDTHIIWSVTSVHDKEGQEVTLVNYENGRLQRDPPEEFQGKVLLDNTTGNLTIGPLGSEHSGLYQSYVYDGDELLSTDKYNITVSQLHPTPVEVPPDDGRNHLAVVSPFILFMVAVLGLMVRTWKLNKGESQGRAEVVRQRA